MLACLPSTEGESLPVPKLSALFIRLEKFSTQASSPKSLCRSKNESSDATFSHYQNASGQHTKIATLVHFGKWPTPASLRVLIE